MKNHKILKNEYSIVKKYFLLLHREFFLPINACELIGKVMGLKG